MNKISFPNIFNKNNKSLNTSISYNVNAINESISTLFYVNEGELLGDPSYGTTIRTLLFDVNNPTLISDIKTKIVDYINKYIPIITVDANSIKIYSNSNNTNFKITISYMINATSEYNYYELIV